MHNELSEFNTKNTNIRIDKKNFNTGFNKQDNVLADENMFKIINDYRNGN